MYNFYEVLLKGECVLFNPFHLHAGWNVESMAGTGAAILDYEIEVVCYTSQSTTAWIPSDVRTVRAAMENHVRATLIWSFCTHS